MYYVNRVILGVRSESTQVSNQSTFLLWQEMVNGLLKIKEALSHHFF